MTDLLFSTDENARAAALTGDFIERYSRTVEKRPVYPRIDRDALRALMRERLPDDGRSLESLFAELEAVIVPNSTQTAHPRFLPYVQPSPTANAVEQTVVRWFGDLLGLGPNVGGLITSGGSMANLIALTAARDRVLGETARTEGLQGQ